LKLERRESRRREGWKGHTRGGLERRALRLRDIEFLYQKVSLLKKRFE